MEPKNRPLPQEMCLSALLEESFKFPIRKDSDPLTEEGLEDPEDKLE